jgi:cytochrome c peroxidase
MPRRFTFLAVAAVLALASLSPPAPAVAPTAERLPYKSPLDLEVDATGQRACVVLHTAGAIAIVDLRAGTVLREIPVGKRPVALDSVKSGVGSIFCEGSDEWITFYPEHEAILGLARHARFGSFRQTDGNVILERSRDLPSWVPSWHAWYAQRRRDWRAWEGELSPFGLYGNWWGPRASVFQWPKHRIPATQVTQGWLFNRLLWVDASGDHKKPRVGVLDGPHQGYADPGAAVESRDWKHVFVCCAGADVVLVLDRKKLPEHGQPMGAEEAMRADLPASRHYLRAVLPTPANPRRLALSGDGKILVVSNYLADSLTVIDAERLEVVRHIPLGGAPPGAARRGEILFNSGKMTAEGQFTCASCHPNGGSDGLTWDLERDGIGNFKKTKSLLGVKDTAPYGWHGSSPTLADRVRGTLRTLHRHEPTDAEVSDLVAYLESLPPPRPLPVLKVDQPAVARGQALFQGKGQCATCHHRVAFDDGKSHDIGTRGPTDTQDRFDTPALRGVARSAPYLHDGRAATLEEVFTKHNSQQRHGAAHTLTREELADLIAYLKSL